jgi:hypothetical protein
LRVVVVIRLLPGAARRRSKPRPGRLEENEQDERQASAGPLRTPRKEKRKHAPLEPGGYGREATAERLRPRGCARGERAAAAVVGPDRDAAWKSPRGEKSGRTQ